MVYISAQSLSHKYETTAEVDRDKYTIALQT